MLELYVGAELNELTVVLMCMFELVLVLLKLHVGSEHLCACVLAPPSADETVPRGRAG